MGDYQEIASESERDEFPARPRVAAVHRDPYYVFREYVFDWAAQWEIRKLCELQKEIMNFRADVNEWGSKTLRGGDSGAVSEMRSLRSRLHSLEQRIRQISKTISQVEKHRSKFREIDDHELHSRKRFVADVRTVLQDCNATLFGEQARGLLQREKDAKPSASVQMVPMGARRQEQQQLPVDKDQEVLLDDMMTSLQRLGVMGETIQVELQAHRDMLHDLDDGMDQATDRMDIALRKVEKLLGTKSRWRMCTIFWLLVLFIILLCAILYT